MPQHQRINWRKHLSSLEFLLMISLFTYQCFFPRLLEAKRVSAFGKTVAIGGSLLYIWQKISHTSTKNSFSITWDYLISICLEWFDDLGLEYLLAILSSFLAASFRNWGSTMYFDLKSCISLRTAEDFCIITNNTNHLSKICFLW